MMALRGPLRVLALLAGAFVLIVAAALLIWRDDILQAFLDPKIPFAVYHPPAAPNYDDDGSWARLPSAPASGDPPVDVLFIHPTTFDGGKDWNGPISDVAARRRLSQIMLPNYAAPFAAAGRVFAPLYRQASLYTSLTLFDDALEARAFAYEDVDRAFSAFLNRVGPDRPFILVGVGQGGILVARLLQDRITTNRGLLRRLVAAYLIETGTPAADHDAGSQIPACLTRQEAGCVAAWISAPRLDVERASRIMSRGVVWSSEGRLVGLRGRELLCFNPILGAASDGAPESWRGQCERPGMGRAPGVHGAADQRPVRGRHSAGEQAAFGCVAALGRLGQSLQTRAL